MFTHFIRTLLVLISADLFSMEVEVKKEEFPEVLSQEVVEAIKQERPLNSNLLIKWRNHYDMVMNQGITSQLLGSFLKPYYEKIREAYMNNSDDIVPATTTYKFSYYPLNSNENKIRSKLVVNANTEPFTLGRGRWNLINLQLLNPTQDERIAKKDVSLSRVHLLFIPFHDGRIFIFDAFSHAGTELMSTRDLTKDQFRELCAGSKRVEKPIFLPGAGNTIILRINQGVLKITAKL